MAKDKQSDKAKFLDCIKESNVTGIYEFASLHKTKKSTFTFEKLLASLNADELAEVWDCLGALAEKYVIILYGSSEEDNSENRIPPESAFEFVQMVILVASLTVELLCQLPLGLLQMAVFLHDMLPLIPEDKDDLKNNIVTMCEKIWIKDLEGKEEIVVNTTMYVLMRSVRKGALKNDIKRAWVLRKTFKLIMNQEDPVKKQFLEILKCCVVSLHYLNSLEGSKLIKYILCLDPSCVENFHRAVKDKLPSCSVKQSKAYGEIYFHSWMKANKKEDEELRNQIEECVQDFMHYAIHLPITPDSILTQLRKLLSVFHVKRKDYNVLKMLRRLYGPILWRSLKHHSGFIRANAAHLFLDVFPLEDPDLRIVETEAELQRQTLFIQDLLLDEYPLVRRVSTTGVCTILTYQWELLPFDMINVYLKIIVNDLAKDSTSSNIRRAVIDGIKLMLENHLAVPALKKVLPQLMPSFHDISEKVRASFCQLLLAVKKNRMITYWDIVPLDHLLARMEEDKPAIAKLIVELIYNSYIPTDQPEECWLRRCIELIKKDPNASHTFFMHVPHCIGLEITTKFIVFICRALKLYVQTKAAHRISSRSGEDKENINQVDEFIKLMDDKGNVSLVVGILDAAVIMFNAIHPELQKAENKTTYKIMIGKIAKCMPFLLKHFKNSKTWISLYNLCSCVPAVLVPEFPGICFNQLKNLSNSGSQDEYSTLLKCLCSLGKSSKVLRVIQECLEQELDKYTPKRLRIRQKQDKNSPKLTFTPQQAASYLETVLNIRTCRFILLEENKEELKNIVEQMNSLLENIEDQRTSLDEEWRKEFLSKVFTSIVKIAVLLHSVGVMDADHFIRRQLQWIITVFLTKNPSNEVPINPRRSSVRNKRASSETAVWRDLGLSLCQDMLSISADVMIVKILVSPVTDYMQFLKHVIKSDYGSDLLISCIHVMLRLSESCKFHSISQTLREENLTFIPDVFAEIINVLSSDDFHTLVKCEIKPLRLLLLSQSTINHENENAASVLMPKLWDGILSKVIPLVENQNETEKICLPLSSQYLISVSTAHVSLLKLFLKNVLHWIKDRSILECLSACLIISHTFKEAKGNLKKAQEIAYELKDALQNIYSGLASNAASSEREKFLTGLMKSSLTDVRLQLKNTAPRSDSSNDSDLTEESVIP